MPDGNEGFGEVAHDEADEVLGLFTGAFSFVGLESGGFRGRFGAGGVGRGFLPEVFLLKIGSAEEGCDQGERSGNEGSREHRSILFASPPKSHELAFLVALCGARVAINLSMRNFLNER